MLHFFSYQLFLRRFFKAWKTHAGPVRARVRMFFYNYHHYFISNNFQLILSQTFFYNILHLKRVTVIIYVYCWQRKNHSHPTFSRVKLMIIMSRSEMYVCVLQYEELPTQRDFSLKHLPLITENCLKFRKISSRLFLTFLRKTLAYVM